MILTIKLYEKPHNLRIDPSMDWRERGAVIDVQNQRTCGSSWAFSAIGSLEAIETGAPVALSKQQLIDCSKQKGNNGCSGAYIEKSFKYIKENGISSEESYPYEGKMLNVDTIQLIQNANVKDL